MWMAGGGVKAGFTYGESDELGFSIARDKVHIHDLQATILHLLGFDHTPAHLPLPRPRLSPDRRERAGREGDFGLTGGDRILALSATEAAAMKSRIVLASALLIAVFAAGYWFVELQILHLRCAFALDQVTIFREMCSKAQGAPPGDVVGYLEYVVGYYPSGSKQLAGSALDEIVESARDSSIRELINRLRISTGRDLGDDPSPWIKEYSQEPRHSF